MKKLLLFILFPFVSHAQIITTICGNDTGGFGGDGGLATLAKLHVPTDVKFDKSGNIYIADYDNNVIRKINTSGIISSVAGNGVYGYKGDGGLAILAEISPYGIAVDDSGNIFVAEYTNNVIRKINTSGIITTIAGNSAIGYSGDGGPAINAVLYFPVAITLDKYHNIYFSDAGNARIRKIDTNGIITTIAGNGTFGYSGDGGLAINAELKVPGWIVISDSNEIFFTDWKNHRVKKIDKSGIITTIAGDGILGNSGDGGLAINAEFAAPTGIAFDKYYNIYIFDVNNFNIRKVNSLGIISTIAGTGSLGFSGDGGPAIDAKLDGPNNGVFDSKGNLFFADGYNNRIRKITYNTVVNNINNTTENLTISPNPAHNTITLTTTNKIATLQITNTLGQVVFYKAYTNTETATIDISSFAVGMYFVKLNGVWSEKFVKE